MAAIFDFGLLVTSDNHPHSTVEVANPKNTGVAVGIFFIAGVQLEIRWGILTLPGHT
jgi:hypothetical protein